MKTKRLRLLAILGLASLALSGCGARTSSSESSKTSSSQASSFGTSSSTNPSSSSSSSPSTIPSSSSSSSSSSQPIAKSTVTFKNYDGLVLEAKQWEKGAIPSYSGATPSRPSDAKYSYVFKGWSPEIVAVSAEATYTAQFTESVNSYLVTFKNFDGSVLESKQWEYGSTPSYSGSTPSRPSDAQYSFAFKGWSPEIVAVSAAAEYQATYTPVPLSTDSADSIVFAADQNKIGTEAFVSPSTFYSGSGSATTGLGCKIGFDYSSFANPTTAWQLIKAGGYFTNADKIPGMKSITLTKANASTSLQVFWSETKVFDSAKSATYDATSAATFTCDFGGYLPDYLKVVALGTGTAAITSGSIAFSWSDSYPTLTLAINNPEFGSVSGGGSYKVGSSVTLAATPESGYSFSGWYDGKSLVSSANPYSFTMPYNDLSYTAKFTANQYTVTLSSSEVATTPVGTCEVSGAGTYAYGSSVTVSAAPAAGYGFLGWYDGDTLLSSSNPYTFAVPAKDVSYVAKYSKKYHVSVASYDETKGTVSGAGDFAYTSSVTVTGTGLGDCKGVTWYDDSFATVSTALAYTFAMPEADIHLSADFHKVLGSSFTLGRYPQTVVEDSATLAALASAADTDSDGYLEYGSDEYKKVTGKPWGSDYKSTSGNTTFATGATYYFKVEPIQWRVLSGKGATTGLVMSEKILINSVYCRTTSSRTVPGLTVYPNYYQYSTLRAMLNGYDGSSYSVDDFTGKGFLDVAFTDSEKACIATTVVETSLSDKLFTLPHRDLDNASYGFSTDASRCGILTDYARAIGAKMTSTDGNGVWWSSSYEYGFYDVWYVDGDGSLDKAGVNMERFGVRPSFTVSIG